MSIIASCGHRLPDDELGVNLALRTWSREGTRGVRYGSFCASCVEKLTEGGFVLSSTEEELAWCAGEGPDDQPCW